jgi:predicted DNA-binding protein with PD1-like motif
LLLEGHVGRVFFSRLLENQDVVESIKKSVQKEGVKTGVFILIGSLRHAVLGFFKDESYRLDHLVGPMEVASCMGNISSGEKGEVVVHAHAVVSNEKGDTRGGHLMKGSLVGATAELVIIEVAGIDLQRILDEKTKLKLWKLH